MSTSAASSDAKDTRRSSPCDASNTRSLAGVKVAMRDITGEIARDEPNGDDMSDVSVNESADSEGADDSDTSGDLESERSRFFNEFTVYCTARIPALAEVVAREHPAKAEFMGRHKPSLEELLAWEKENTANESESEVPGEISIQGKPKGRKLDSDLKESEETRKFSEHDAKRRKLDIQAVAHANNAEIEDAFGGFVCQWILKDLFRECAKHEEDTGDDDSESKFGEEVSEHGETRCRKKLDFELAL